MLEHASPLVRLLGQWNALHHDASLLERELAVLRSQRERKPSHQRPHFSPAERAQILEVMKLPGVLLLELLEALRLVGLEPAILTAPSVGRLICDHDPLAHRRDQVRKSKFNCEEEKLQADSQRGLGRFSTEILYGQVPA